MIGHPSLGRAVEMYRNGRRALEDEVSALGQLGHVFDPEETWPASWLPLTFEQDMLAIDTRADDVLAPVHVVIHEEPILDPVAASLGELVRLWIEAIRSGAWTWDRANRVWGRELSRLPEELRRHPYFF